MENSMWWKMATVLFLAGIVFLSLGTAVVNNNREPENFKKFQETAVLYEKVALLQGPERDKAISLLEDELVRLAMQTQNDKLSAAAFYNAGDRRISLNLKKTILYLRESLIKDPSLERAQRNLEIAWREVKENNLDEEMDPRPADGEGENGGKEKGNGNAGKKQLNEEEESGTANTEEPLPYSEEEGFGRGGYEHKDF